MPLAPPTLADFEQKEEIAWGSLATIIEVVYKANRRHYALKILNKEQLVKKKVIRSATVEKDALIKLGKQAVHHPGIVRLHHCFQDVHHLYFVLDLASNGDLKILTQKHGSLSLTCSKYYTAQLVDAVQFLHKSGVIHRDIKPENILLDSEMRLKLADFGCAHVGTDMETARTNSFVGTAAYISPEVLARLEANPKSPDLWAIGCTLYFFFFGSSPFLAATEYLTMKRVKALDYTFPSVCDADATDLIQRLLVLDPAERLGVDPKSAEELRQHSFFVGHQASSPSNSPPPTTDGTVVNWESLWKEPAPKVEPGTYRSKPKGDVPSDIWSDFESLQISSD